MFEKPELRYPSYLSDNLSAGMSTFYKVSFVRVAAGSLDQFPSPLLIRMRFNLLIILSDRMVYVNSCFCYGMITVDIKKLLPATKKAKDRSFGAYIRPMVLFNCPASGMTIIAASTTCKTLPGMEPNGIIQLP